ncbi:MAG: carboxypeptidase-like regulatory domain-containing protein [Verrucomicrobia bacterium]|nr:carboxypeptidase-like regulatory domain-containing protein [Verrucomicrobiota bacterium]
MNTPAACPHPAPLRLFIRIVLLIASLALPSAASAQTTANGTIEGRVLNTRNGEFLENARITIEGTALVVLTDATGQYRFLNVPVGVVKRPRGAHRNGRRHRRLGRAARLQPRRHRKNVRVRQG